MDTASLFLEIGVLLGLASVLGYIAKLLKQPPIIAYIIAGFILGAPMLNVLNNGDMMSVFSGFGIAFLLFTVGLELSIREIKEVGRIAAMVGIAQVIVTACAGFVMMALLGFNPTDAFFIGIAATFSSTILVVKVMSEKRELHSLHGRVTLGILLAQDIVAIFSLIVVAGLAGHLPLDVLALQTILKTAAVFIGIAALTKYVVPPVFDRMAKWGELLFVSSLAYCFILAYITHSIGLSAEIGALLAGISLATLHYNVEIVGRVRTLRDFFLILFFVTLGSQITGSTDVVWWAVAALTGFVLIVNPLIVMIIMGIEGYSKRTSLLTGLATAQISEFSLIIIALAGAASIVSPSAVTLITVTWVLTMAVSVYMIQYNDHIYAIIGKYLKGFQAKHSTEEARLTNKPLKGHAILFGHHRMGPHIAERLKKLGMHTVVIDFDPEVVRHLKDQESDCMYGDMGDPDIWERAGIADARVIVSTVPYLNDTLALIHAAKKAGQKALIVATAEETEEAKELYRAGADYVILPRVLGGEFAGDMISQLVNGKTKRGSLKTAHLKQLNGK